jgi:hypothetical protein
MDIMVIPSFMKIDEMVPNVIDRRLKHTRDYTI